MAYIPRSLINGRPLGMVSLTEFGAKRDGSDDSTAFHKAVASGEPIWLPPGNTIGLGSDYQLSLPENRPIFISGPGRDAVTLKVLTSMPALFTKGTGYVVGSRFEGFSVDAARLADRIFDIGNYTSAQFANLFLTKPNISAIRNGNGGTNMSNMLHFDDVRIQQSASDPDYAGHPENLPLYGIENDTNAYDGHYNNVTISNIQLAGILDNGANNNFSGVHIYGWPEPLDTVNDPSGYDYRPQYGIDTAGRAVISGKCYFDTIKTAGVRVRGPHVAIVGNRFYWPFAHADSYPVELYDGISDFTMVGNTFDGLASSLSYNLLGAWGSNVCIFGNIPEYDRYIITNHLRLKQTVDSVAGILAELDSMPGRAATLRLLTQGMIRWEIYKNVSGDFAITRYADGGTTLGSPIIINHTTGAVTMTDGSLTVTGTYQAPLLIGSMYLWDGGNGHLYYKATAPTGATDGTQI